jgi:outer membrane cobalamin receptor
LVRGTASDLYGSNALSGVIHILRPQPVKRDLQFESSGGGEGTREASALASGTHAQWEALLALHWLVTDGYTLVAPNLQGPVDQPSSLHSQFAYNEVRRRFNADASIFLRTTVMNEARGNGTLLQNNATRLWRYAGGADWHTAGDWQLRLFGSNENYRQSFSSINPARTVETLTRQEHTPAQELGGSLLWTHTLGKDGVVLLGSDVHDVRATDLETAIGNGVVNGPTNIGVPTGFTDTTARQRQTGVFAEVLYTHGPWTASAALRGDHAAAFDGDQTAAGSQRAAGVYPSTTEDVANPKLGLVRRINPHIAFSASAGRAFRVPTLNELYRTGQVGQIVTQPNATLLPERAMGAETGVQMESSRGNTRLHASYFWTEVNRPIVAVTQTPVLNMRENLGQIRSRGVSLDWQSMPLQWMTIGGGYQFANATVTRGPIDIGNWIPEVAHNMATLLVNLHRSRWGVLHATGRVNGHMYDDDVNQYRLSGYFRLDLSAEHSIGSHAVFVVGLENAFNRSIQAGRTPVLTLAGPQDFNVSLRWNFHPA